MTQPQYDDRGPNGSQVRQAPMEQLRPDLAQQQALQVLTMAQRTAEEHIEAARREVEHIRAEAHATAEQIVAEAQGEADALRDEADKILARARMSAEKVARDSEAFAVDTERHAGEVLAGAQNQADEIMRSAQANAQEIRQRAEQNYEDVVGGLSAKRQALQQQIEALEHFDHEYRARLTAFMQQQMRALWVPQPQVTADIVEEGEASPAELLPAQREQDLDKPGSHAAG